MKAVVLLSGGLDSTVMLALAISQGRQCHAISFDYGQKHRVELESAKAVAAHYGIPHRIIAIEPITFWNSSLVGDQSVPKGRTSAEIGSGSIPSTYVPARNTIFLSYALALAEVIGAQEVHYGPNALDAKPYVDCRPEFIAAYQALSNVATAQAVSGNPPRIVAPLIDWDKAEIIRQGMRLDAPLELTFSCYDPLNGVAACGKCDACVLRNEGFLRR